MAALLADPAVSYRRRLYGFEVLMSLFCCCEQPSAILMVRHSIKSAPICGFANSSKRTAFAIFAFMICATHQPRCSLIKAYTLRSSPNASDTAT